MATKSGFYCPNKMVRIYLTAIEEMIGGEAMPAVLNSAQLANLVKQYPPNNTGKELSN